jgi:hypothetical protein
MDTEQFIQSLKSDLQPVRPLRPPWLRALGWLLLIALLATWPVLRFADLAEFGARHADPRVATETIATLLTGLSAIVAAFYLSIPGRSDLWRWLPLVPLTLWLASSGVGCVRNGFGSMGRSRLFGYDIDCFVFVVMISVPLSLLLMAFLRRARPLAPRTVALTGGLGVAGIAAFLLQFFHPFEVTVIDLTLHVAAVAVVLSAAATFGRRALARG